MIVIREGPFICAVSPHDGGNTLGSSQVDCTALAAAAQLLLPGFVADAVAPSAGGGEDRSPGAQGVLLGCSGSHARGESADLILMEAGWWHYIC